MKEMYQSFIKQEKERAKSSSDKLHELYETKNQLYNIISKQRSRLMFNNFPIHYIDDIQNNKIKDRSTFALLDDYLDDSQEDFMLKANIKSYLSLNWYTLPQLKKKLKFHILNAHITERNFRILIGEMNNQISNYVLLGNKFNMPFVRASLKIYKYKRDFKKRAVNWGETNKAKKTDPNAKIYHVDDYYIGVRFTKRANTPSRNRLYKFKFTSFINTKKRQQLEYYNSVKHIKDVINDNKVGNLEKMLAIKHLKGINFYPQIS